MYSLYCDEIVTLDKKSMQTHAGNLITTWHRVRIGPKATRRVNCIGDQSNRY